MADEIIIVPADSTWSQRFEEEKARILAALDSRFVAIEHFGSTAIPELAAKPVIDMLGGVRSMHEADELLAPLCNIGYDTSAEFNATLSDRRFLRRRAGEIRTHHLHLVVYGGEQWKRRLLFRDILRAEPSIVQSYELLKYELASQFRDDREAYTEAKGAFVADVLKRYSGLTQ